MFWDAQKCGHASSQRTWMASQKNRSKTRATHQKQKPKKTKTKKRLGGIFWYIFFECGPGPDLLLIRLQTDLVPITQSGFDPIPIQLQYVRNMAPTWFQCNAVRLQINPNLVSIWRKPCPSQILKVVSGTGPSRFVFGWGPILWDSDVTWTFYRCDINLVLTRGHGEAVLFPGLHQSQYTLMSRIMWIWCQYGCHFVPSWSKLVRPSFQLGLKLFHVLPIPLTVQQQDHKYDPTRIEFRV